MRSDFSLNNRARNVAICREHPITYREDMALEYVWHKEVGTVGLNHTMASRLGQCYLRWLR